MADTYTTIQGDTWDIVALKCYQDEKQMHRLIEANPEHRDTVFFSAGVELAIPAIEISQISEALPPWKQ